MKRMFAMVVLLFILVSCSQEQVLPTPEPENLEDTPIEETPVQPPVEDVADNEPADIPVAPEVQEKQEEIRPNPLAKYRLPPVVDDVKTTTDEYYEKFMRKVDVYSTSVLLKDASDEYFPMVVTIGHGWFAYKTGLLFHVDPKTRELSRPLSFSASYNDDMKLIQAADGGKIDGAVNYIWYDPKDMYLKACLITEKNYPDISEKDCILGTTVTGVVFDQHPKFPHRWLEEYGDVEPIRIREDIYSGDTLYFDYEDGQQLKMSLNPTTFIPYSVQILKDGKIVEDIPVLPSGQSVNLPKDEQAYAHRIK